MQLGYVGERNEVSFFQLEHGRESAEPGLDLFHNGIVAQTLAAAEHSGHGNGFGRAVFVCDVIIREFVCCKHSPGNTHFFKIAQSSLVGSFGHVALNNKGLVQGQTGCLDGTAPDSGQLVCDLEKIQQEEDGDT